MPSELVSRFTTSSRLSFLVSAMVLEWVGVSDLLPFAQAPAGSHSASATTAATRIFMPSLLSAVWAPDGRGDASSLRPDADAGFIDGGRPIPYRQYVCQGKR